MPDILELLSGLFSPGEAEAAGARTPSMQMQMLQNPALRQRMQEMKLQEQAAQIMLRELMKQQAQQQDPMRQLQLQQAQQRVTAGAEKARPQPSITELLGGGGATQPSAAPEDVIFRGTTPETGTPFFTNYPEGLPAWVSPEERQQFTQRFEAARAKAVPQPRAGAQPAARAQQRAQLAASIKTAYPSMPEKELTNLLDATFPEPTLAPGAPGEAALANLDPGTAALVKSVANYQIPIAGFGSMPAKIREKVLPLVAQYDPTFDATQYAPRVKLRQDFLTGKQGQNKVALNTAIGHMARFQASANSLENIGDIPGAQLWNYIKNKGLETSGDPTVDRVMTDAKALADELSKVFKGTSGTDQEVRGWLERLSTSKSPKQFRAIVDEAIGLLGGRFDAIHQIWKEGMGKPYPEPFMTDTNRKIITEMGYDPDVIEHRTPGTTEEAPLRAEPKTTKKLASREDVGKAMRQSGGDKQKALQLLRQQGFTGAQ